MGIKKPHPDRTKAWLSAISAIQAVTQGDLVRWVSLETGQRGPWTSDPECDWGSPDHRWEIKSQLKYRPLSPEEAMSHLLHSRVIRVYDQQPFAVIAVFARQVQLCGPSLYKAKLVSYEGLLKHYVYGSGEVVGMLLEPADYELAPVVTDSNT